MQRAANENMQFETDLYREFSKAIQTCWNSVRQSTQLDRKWFDSSGKKMCRGPLLSRASPRMCIKERTKFFLSPSNVYCVKAAVDIDRGLRAVSLYTFCKKDAEYVSDRSCGVRISWGMRFLPLKMYHL